MKNLFELKTADEVISRIEKVQPTSPRQWGKMDSAQMLAHCCATMDMASGRLNLRRSMIGRLFGPFFKAILTNEKPLGKNSPTDKKLRVDESRDFFSEQGKLQSKVGQFQEGGEKKCTRHPHPFFGPLTPQDWARGMYKHLDHHLRQFGV